jgi:type IV secretory pathway VirB6-like protein
MFYGGSYLMGISQFSNAEIMTRIVKIGVLFLFLTPGGWLWFQNIFVEFFEKGADYLSILMISSFESDSVVNKALNDKYFDPALLFSSIDKMISLFSLTVFYKLSALFFSSMFGWLYLLIIFWSITLYFKVAIQVILLYLSAKLFINFTFLLAPILFLFLLFEQTKDTFDKWIKQIASFALQQIIILFSFSLFNAILYHLFKSLLSYKICWGSVWTIDLIVDITLFQWWIIAGGMDGGAGEYAPTLVSVLTVYFTVLIMQEFTNSSSNFAERMVDGISSAPAAQSMQAQASKSLQLLTKQYDYLRKKSGIHEHKILGKVVGKYGVRDKLMGVVFNTSREIEENRSKARDEEIKNIKSRAELVAAGNKAVREYKKQAILNGDKLFTTDKTEDGKDNMMERIEMMKKVRKEAEIAALKKHMKGKKDGEIEKKRNELMDKRRKNTRWSNHNDLTSAAISEFTKFAYSKNNLNSVNDAEGNSENRKDAAQELIKNIKDSKITLEEANEKLERIKDEHKKDKGANSGFKSKSDHYLDTLDDRLEKIKRGREKQAKKDQAFLKKQARFDERQKPFQESKEKRKAEYDKDKKSKGLFGANINNAGRYLKDHNRNKTYHRLKQYGTEEILGYYEGSKLNETYEDRKNKYEKSKESWCGGRAAGAIGYAGRYLDARFGVSDSIAGKLYAVSDSAKFNWKQSHIIESSAHIVKSSAQSSFQSALNTFDKIDRSVGTYSRDVFGGKAIKTPDARQLAEKHLKKQGKITSNSDRVRKKIKDEEQINTKYNDDLLKKLGEELGKSSEQYKEMKNKLTEDSKKNKEKAGFLYRTLRNAENIFRERWTKDELGKIDTEVKNIRESGGIKKLQERKEEIIKHYISGASGKKDVEKLLGITDKDGNLLQKDIKERAEDYLLDGSGEQNWRDEIFPNKNQESDVSASLGKSGEKDKKVTSGDSTT